MYVLQYRGSTVYPVTRIASTTNNKKNEMKEKEEEKRSTRVPRA